MHQKWVAGCLWHDLNMPRTCPGHVRTCPGHGKTHEDSYGFLKIQNRTQTHQDTDIFVLQIANCKLQTWNCCFEQEIRNGQSQSWDQECGSTGRIYPIWYVGGNHQRDNSILPYHFGRPDDNSVEKNYGEDWTVKSKFRTRRQDLVELANRRDWLKICSNKQNKINTFFTNFFLHNTELFFHTFVLLDDPHGRGVIIGL